MVTKFKLQKTYTTGVVTLTLDATEQEESYEKIQQDFTTPKSTSRQIQNPDDANFGPTKTKIVDLLRIRKLHIVDGVIAQGDYGTDTHAAVSDRKIDLRNMYLAGGVITFDADDQTGLTGSITKLVLRKVSNDAREDDGYEDGEYGYTFKLTIVEGVDFA